MIRLFHTYFPSRTILLGLSETALITLAFVAATVLRFGSDSDLVLGNEHGLLKISLVAATFLLSMYYLDLYDTGILNNRHQLITRLVQVLGLGTMLMGVIYYAFPGASLSRGIFSLGLVLLFPFLFFWRHTFFWLIRSLHLSQRAVIVGNNALAAALINEIHNRPELGVEVAGYVGAFGGREPIGGAPHLGELEMLPDVAHRARPARIIIAMEDRRGRLPLEQLLSIKTKGTLIQDGIELYESITGKVPINAIRPACLLFSDGFYVSRSRLLYKRFFSILISTVCLVLALPLLVLIAIAIRLDSPGPIIFRQQRVGKNGDLFTLYKFRTMFDHCDPLNEHAPAQESDPRVTRVGWWLRHIRLDELPQLFNILRGDMYFVGPRPFVPDQENQYAQHIPYYHHRWAVRPGATGWAQINRGYCTSLEDNAEKLAYDLFYIKNMSFGLDFLILFHTMKILLLGRGGR